MVQVRGGGGGVGAQNVLVPAEDKSGGDECLQLTVWTHAPQPTRLPLDSHLSRKQSKCLQPSLLCPPDHGSNPCPLQWK